MAAGYNPRTVTDGLVLALDAGNTKSYPGSGTTWKDLSGKGNNGFFRTKNKSFKEGIDYRNDSGGNFEFDESSESAISTLNTLESAYNLFPGINDSITGESSTFWSVTTWFNTSSVDSGTRAIIAKGDGTFNSSLAGNSVFLYLNRAVLRIKLRNSSAKKISNIETGVWYNVAITWDGSSGTKTAKVYLNGNFVTETNVINTKAQNTSRYQFNIGATENAERRFFKGKISYVSAYNRALTAEEVKQNYNALKERYV